MQFASGSHRDFALPYWHAALETFDLGSRGYALEDAGGLALGDVTWHAGWTLHYSDPAPHCPPRLALAASYFAADLATVLPQVRFLPPLLLLPPAQRPIWEQNPFAPEVLACALGRLFR